MTSQPNLTGPADRAEIGNRLRNRGRKQRNDGSLTATGVDSGNGVTGQTITRQDDAQHGDAARPADTRGVHVTPRYQPGREPPYAVLTPYPK